MKTFKTLSIIVVALLVTVFSCKKEEETIIPYNCTLEVNSSQITQNTESFTNNNLVSPITGKDGTEISFTPNSFSGTPSRIDVVDSQDNKDMLLMGYPTVDNNGNLLISAGVCFISAYDDNGDLLSINPSAPPTVNIPNTTNSSDMNVYSASVNANGEFVWVDQGQPPIPPTQSPNSEYQNVPVPSSSVNNLSGGVNMDIPGPPCITNLLTINLPSGRNGGNSSVYIYFTNQNSVVTAYDGNEDGKFEISDIFCSGDTVQFVLISQIEGIKKWYVSDPADVSDNNWTKTISSNDLEPALCAEALRLLIKEELE